ncbi:MAG TPA: PQQ-binding-like beta-propeller repeat protein [Pirellulales bacterium]|jgi:outer membrane protein assembly factor BamB|nr:PQQ-binding-like beta-propeller repeat protein [Pirellulales bacterium]
MPLSITNVFACCLALLTLVAPRELQADDWPQWRGPTRDGVWRETGLVDHFDSAQLPLAWRAPIAAGYSGPTVCNGRVFVTDRLVEPQQAERVHAFDSKTGKPLWTFEYECKYSISYPAGPRAAVSIDEGRAFALGATGRLHALDAASGAVLWKKDLEKEYGIRMPIWGIAASPLVDRDLLIVQIGGKDNACLVAFDKKSGAERWRALDDDASYAAPIITEQNGQRVLICLTGQHIAGLKPDSGEVLWKYPFPPKQMVIGIPTPVIDGQRLFVTTFYEGSLMLRLVPDRFAVEKLWARRGTDEKHTDALHSIISTPLAIDGYIYGVDSYGELRCLDEQTGKRIWESDQATPHTRWSTIHFVRNGDREWLFNERGELIIARLTPEGYDEISRTKLLEPTTEQLRQRGGVCWSHPAFANRHVFARNDRELVCASLNGT